MFSNTTYLGRWGCGPALLGISENRTSVVDQDLNKHQLNAPTGLRQVSQRDKVRARRTAGTAWTQEMVKSQSFPGLLHI